VDFVVDVYINVGFAQLGAYQITATFDPGEVQLVTTLGDQGVSPGSGPFGGPASVNPSVPGEIRWNDVESSPTGPAYTGTIHVAALNFRALAVCRDTVAFGGFVEELVNGMAMVIFGPFPTPIAPQWTTITQPLGAVVLCGPDIVPPGAPVSVELHAEVGTRELASYRVTLTYALAFMQLDTSFGTMGVTAGSSPLGLPTSVLVTSPGIIEIEGSAMMPSGPSYTGDQHVCTIHFNTPGPSCSVTGLPFIRGTVEELVDSAMLTIGGRTPRGMPTFAYECGLICGDVTLDGILTILDALRIAQHAVGVITLMPGPLSVADVDRSGRVNILDSLLIAQTTVGLRAPPDCR
jgi:hypothetical protein